jgi:NADH-quinone oxidoreductase subunit F
MSKRLESAADLKAVAEKYGSMIESRMATSPQVKPGSRRHIMVCMGGGCIASGAAEIRDALAKAISKHRLDKIVHVYDSGCLGPCAFGPVIVVYPDGVFYQGLKVADAEVVIKEHIIGGKVVERLVNHRNKTNEAVPLLKDIEFLNRQTKVVLRNCGVIDPLSIEEYIGRGGYAALAKVLSGMTPDQVIDTLKASGLRGRGGAGFPTWLKWSLTRKASGDQKYVLCNADEGDPGAFMDRSVLEGDPHSVIEAMAVAGYTVGASEGFVYVRAEYPLAVERLGKAIEDARARGLLGANILGAGFSFDLDIRMGSGAFVCGEETALMRSIEGKRGEPRPRPPFPANKGLWDRPSLLNNVETYAAIPAILLKGAEWYASMGTPKSKGTKVFALAGAVNNTGLVEIPIGTPLGEIIYDIGGGITGGKAFKAAQIGGPSGGCIPRAHLNVPVDYESLTELGAIMGSGGLIVMNEESCMVDVARYFLDFVQDESCGKCVPCRVGTKRMLEILDRICEGKGEMADIDRLIQLGTQIKDTALCGLGQTAPNPVLSTIRHFKDEYVAHIRDKKCPAGVCPALVRAPCQNACPAGVDVPGFVSLVGEKRYKDALKLHRERNPFAGLCASVCYHPCENSCRRSDLDDAVSIRGVKRFMVETEKAPVVPEARAAKENSKKRVAVVGAGPAGLTSAYFLSRLGYKPEVFEAMEKPGGMPQQTIPTYRLPRQVLFKEIRMIQDMGVKIHTGKRLGRDFTLTGLKEKGFEAVVLAVGAPDGTNLGIPGEDAEGVADGISFLREFNLTGTSKVGRRVAIVGGGNVAVDVARTAIRLGAESVDVLYRRTRDQMPAYEQEVEEAVKEGVKFHFLLAPVEIAVTGGKARGVRCRRMKLGEFDRTGRRRPEDATGEEVVFEADQVIAAVGQSLDTASLMNGAKLAVGRSGYLVADPVSGQTSEPWVFAAGDAVSGPASVVEAIGAGERAAVGVDRFLSGKENAFWRREMPTQVSFDADADPAATAREELPELPVKRRSGNFAQVELAWSAKTAVCQAKRCLRCDYREEETKVGE